MEQLNSYAEAADFDEVAWLAWDGLKMSIKSGSLGEHQAKSYMNQWFPTFIIPIEIQDEH